MSLVDFLPARRAPGRKNRRAWCRGKVGVAHVVEVTIPSNAHAWKRGCSWSTWWPGRWFCDHIYACKNCGKHLATVMPEDCPMREAQP